MTETAQRYTLAIVAHLALLLAWYLFVTLGNVPKFVMPSPGATLDALLQPNYNWWTNIAVPEAPGVRVLGQRLDRDTV